MSIRSICRNIVCLVMLVCVTGCVMPITKENLMNVSTYTFEDTTKPPKMTNTVQRGQTAIMRLTFTWDKEGPAGWHGYSWKMYQGDKFIGKWDKGCEFTKSPFELSFRFVTTAYPAGDYRWDFVLDGQPITSIPVSVTEVAGQ